MDANFVQGKPFVDKTEKFSTVLLLQTYNS